MSSAPLTDTSDMVALHGSFRRAFADAPAQIGGVAEGDLQSAGRLAAYLAEMLWMLHAHHEGEDAVLYPRLVERSPEHTAVFAEMERQHAAVSVQLLAAETAVARFGTTATPEDSRQAVAALGALAVALDPHLSEEEDVVLPVAAQVMTPPEWGELPGHAMRSYAGERMWMPFGLALEAMPEKTRSDVLASCPPPIAAMWRDGGEAAYVAEMAAIRGLADHGPSATGSG